MAAAKPTSPQPPVSLGSLCRPCKGKGLLMLPWPGYGPRIWYPCEDCRKYREPRPAPMLPPPDHDPPPF